MPEFFYFFPYAHGFVAIFKVHGLKLLFQEHFSEVSNPRRHLVHFGGSG